MANYALIMGINNYTPADQDGLMELHGAIPDAESVYQWAISRGNVPVQNCFLIKSTNNPLTPVKSVIDSTIVTIVRNIINNGGDADRFYFYFAGHGLGVELDMENNALCMADWSEYMRDAAALSSKEYKRKFLNEGLFKEVVIWMDCCRNIKMYLNPGAGPGNFPSLGPNVNPKWFVGFATQFQNQAFEVDNLATATSEKRGIFTKVLLDGLNGGASTNGAIIDADALRNYLTFNVPTEAQKAGFTQIPEISHNSSVNFPMIF